MYIGVISDTHGILGKEFVEFLQPVDQIWHAGDWGGGGEFARRFAEAFPGKTIVGVHGNCDGADIRYEYPACQFFEADGMGVLLTHIGGTPGHYAPAARQLIEANRPGLFVCGHSHILKVCRDDHYDMMYLNPGAAGIQGWQVVRTALRFRIDAGELKDMEVFNLPR